MIIGATENKVEKKTSELYEWRILFLLLESNQAWNRLIGDRRHYRCESHFVWSSQSLQASNPFEMKTANQYNPDENKHNESKQ